MILRGERVFRRVPLGVYDSASGGLDWSPDGRRRAYGSSWGDSSSLWLVRIEDGSRSRLTGGGETSDINPVWSPDGSKIYYEHGGGLLNWEGKGDRWLDTVTISPDGTKIAYLLGERGMEELVARRRHVRRRQQEDTVSRFDLESRARRLPVGCPGSARGVARLVAHLREQALEPLLG